MITEKYKYAEDENFWKMKEKNHKNELDNLMKQFKKERSELLERIDRMKKTVGGKDKKMDYYQSAFKWCIPLYTSHQHYSLFIYLLRRNSNPNC